LQLTWGHIRTIVAAQQTYARRGGVTESVDIAGLVDNAVAIHFADTAYDDQPQLPTVRR